MTFATTAASLAERYGLPDFVIRAGMRRVIAANDRQATPPGTEAEFARGMGAYAIAEHADAANRQHYELPPESCVSGPAVHSNKQGEKHVYEERRVEAWLCSHGPGEAAGNRK